MPLLLQVLCCYVTTFTFTHTLSLTSMRLGILRRMFVFYPPPPKKRRGKQKSNNNNSNGKPYKCVGEKWKPKRFYYVNEFFINAFIRKVMWMLPGWLPGWCEWMKIFVFIWMDECVSVCVLHASLFFLNIAVYCGRKSFQQMIMMELEKPTELHCTVCVCRCVFLIDRMEDAINNFDWLFLEVVEQFVQTLQHTRTLTHSAHSRLLFIKSYA